MKRLYVSVYILLLLLAAQDMSAQRRVYSNEFLNIGVGARGLGMGSTLSATVNDVTSSYWNPAGQNNIKNVFQIGAMHNEYFAGLGKFDFIGLAIPLKGVNLNSSIGLTYYRFGVDNIPNTLDLIDVNGNINYDNISLFSTSDNAMMITYAFSLNKISGNFNWNDIRFGTNFKIIRRTVGPFAKSWGFGLDAGAQYDWKNLHIALLGKDITTTYNAWSFTFTDEEKEVLSNTGNVIPVSSYEITSPRATLGAAYDLKFLKDNFRFTPSFELNNFFDKRNALWKGNGFSIEPAIGFEFGYKEFVFLRAGINKFQKYVGLNTRKKEKLHAEPNVGLGLKLFKSLSIDYAFTNVNSGTNELYSHVISASFGFNKKKEQDIIDFQEKTEQTKVPKKEKTPKVKKEIEEKIKKEKPLKEDKEKEVKEEKPAKIEKDVKDKQEKPTGETEKKKEIIDKNTNKEDLAPTSDKEKKSEKEKPSKKKKTKHKKPAKKKKTSKKEKDSEPKKVEEPAKAPTVAPRVTDPRKVNTGSKVTDPRKANP